MFYGGKGSGYTPEHQIENSSMFQSWIPVYIAILLILLPLPNFPLPYGTCSHKVLIHPLEQVS